MTPRVRPSTEADMAHVRDIYAHYVATSCCTFEEHPPTLDDMLARRASILAAGMPFLVAELGTAILGYAYFTAFRPRSAYRFTIENSVYVTPTSHGQGIGTALMHELLRIATAGPWQQMIAVIGDSTNTASIRLHERLGFTHSGKLHSVGFKHGRWLDTTLMQRSVTLLS